MIEPTFPGRGEAPGGQRPGKSFGGYTALPKSWFIGVGGGGENDAAEKPHRGQAGAKEAQAPGGVGGFRCPWGPVTPARGKRPAKLFETRAPTGTTKGARRASGRRDTGRRQGCGSAASLALERLLAARLGHR